MNQLLKAKFGIEILIFKQVHQASEKLNKKKKLNAIIEKIILCDRLEKSLREKNDPGRKNAIQNGKVGS